MLFCKNDNILHTIDLTVYVKVCIKNTFQSLMLTWQIIKYPVASKIPTPNSVLSQWMHVIFCCESENLPGVCIKILQTIHDDTFDCPGPIRSHESSSVYLFIIKFYQQSMCSVSLEYDDCLWIFGDNGHYLKTVPMEHGNTQSLQRSAPSKCFVLNAVCCIA